MRQVRTGIAFGVVMTMAAAGPVAAQQPEPPVWIVEDEDSIVYMVGTVHVSRDGLDWRSSGYDEAIAQADAVWLEIPDFNPPDNVMALISEHAMSPDQPLTAHLSEEHTQQLEQILAEHGIPLESFEDLAPWYAYLQITGLLLQASGFDPALGIDVAIRAEAEERGLPIHGFESFESQFMMLAEMPEDMQVEILVQTIEEYDQAVEELYLQLESWISGDLSDLEAMTADMADEMSEFYQTLFAARNETFVDGIEEILAGEGTTLVAVGLGHYVGPDSIPAILEERGYTVERR